VFSQGRLLSKVSRCESLARLLVFFMLDEGCSTEKKRQLNRFPIEFLFAQEQTHSKNRKTIGTKLHLLDSSTVVVVLRS